MLEVSAHYGAAVGRPCLKACVWELHSRCVDGRTRGSVMTDVVIFYGDDGKLTTATCICLDPSILHAVS
jgi:hypothetical protein